MAIKELLRFNELADACGNRYLAVKWVSEWARELYADNSEYKIVESKLIQWVITGECPYIDSELQKRRVIHDDDKLDDFLAWVCDEDVCSAVKEAYTQSIHESHVICYHNNDLTPGQNARTNILLRMFWYSISKED